MSTMTATTNPPAPAATGPAEIVGVRHKLSALWTAVLFVFVYVDLFSFFRPDVRADIEAGEIAGFTIGEGFLLATTIYVVIPSVMVFLSLVLPRKVARPTTIALAVAYLLTIVAGAVGEWGYYIFGSIVEAALLVTMIVLARRWTTD
jgi:hypothetical protein